MFKIIDFSKMSSFILVILCTFLATQAFAQKRTISGKVTESGTGLSLPGVNIIEKGTMNGVITDMDGNYSLTVDENGILVFSFIGFTSQEIPVKGKTSLDVVLMEEARGLDEVVVTGYQTQRKADLTGAVSVVAVEDLEKNVTANAMKSLQGQVAGMFVTSDGRPSGAANVQIRGINSINASTTPLYIIDGVPTTAGMHEINPNDIESMQVLKDAAAASIYGSRASNGVIIITTKKGKSDKTVLEVKSHVGTSFYANRPQVLNTMEYGQAYWQAAVNDGADPNRHFLYKYQWHANEEGVPVLDNILLPKYLDANKTMLTSNTNWYNEISRVGIEQNHNVTFSKGNQAGSSLFSLGFYDNQGIIKTTGFNRLSARINSDYKLFNGKFRVGENLSMTKTLESNTDVLNLTLQTLPVIPVHTETGGWGGPVAGMNDRHNPVRILEDNKQNHYNYLRLYGNVYGELDLMKGLTFRSNYGIDYGSFFERILVYSYKSGYLNNDLNRVNNKQSHSIKQTLSNTLIYNLAAGKSKIDFLAGMESYGEYFEEFEAGIETFEVEDPDYMYINAGTGKRNTAGWGTEYRLLSYFGKVDYNFSDRYLASMTLRYDGSSRFGKNNKFGMFPAASIGWRINEESFMEDLDKISNLKLRFGWGQTGNQAINNLARYSVYVTDYNGGNPTWASPWGTAYDIAGTGGAGIPSGYKRTRLGNDDLKWETTTQSNIGLDFGFWDQKLSGSLEFYSKKTEDMLFEPGYIGVIGEGGNQFVNGATMTNKGVELVVDYRGAAFGKKLSYNITGNIAANRNKIVDLPEAVRNAYGGNGRDQNILGRPLWSYYGYVADGIFKDPDDVANSAESVGKALGRIKYKDLDGNGVITDDDRAWLGNPHPDFTYGLNFSASYQNFDLSFFWQGVVGNTVVNDAKFHTDFWSVKENGSNKGTRLLDAWSPLNPDSNIPALTLVDSNNENRFSTYVLESGSYLKLRNLQVGYTLPLKDAVVTKARVYAGGQNLVILSKWWGDDKFTGLDPENPGWGYPIPTNFTFGVNLTF
ncbi:MAG: TonB-dependent receptor [Bacteroidales bacterium]|nr:TonB-dependent receptor [Bacteroidales bacterium]